MNLMAEQEIKIGTKLPKTVMKNQKRNSQKWKPKRGIQNAGLYTPTKLQDKHAGHIAKYRQTSA